MILEPFAGGGGLSEGLAAHGAHGYGYESNPAACETGNAAGHARIRADVTAVKLDKIDPERTTVGVAGSPVCTAISVGGSKNGIGDLAAVKDLLSATVQGEDRRMHYLFNVFADHRSGLMVEPMRWALGTGARWLIVEQVPAALTVWQAYLEQLGALGWYGQVGVVDAADYGAPTIRRRAIGVFHRHVPVALPAPTHHRTGAGGLLPWVTMAEAVGYGMTHRPYPTIACSNDSGGPDREKVGGSGARKALYAERDAGRWITQPGNPDPRLRIGVADLGVLQTFRRDYPWRGTQTEQFRQIGNAVPPALAAAIAAPVLEADRNFLADRIA